MNRIKKAYAIANNAIYFGDDADYEFALYQVCKMLKPLLLGDYHVSPRFVDGGYDEDIGQEYIKEED